MHVQAHRGSRVATHAGCTTALHVLQKKPCMRKPHSSRAHTVHTVGSANDCSASVCATLPLGQGLAPVGCRLWEKGKRIH